MSASDTATSPDLPAAGASQMPEKNSPPKTGLRRKFPLILAGIVGLGLIVGGGLWWQNKQRWEATDNAFVEADTTAVSPMIDGYVVEVLVHDNETVEAGQILVRLDDADARARLAEAQANLAAVQAGVSNVDARATQEQAVISARAAAVAQARSQADLAEAELQRYGQLAEQGWVSQQRIQTQRAQTRTAQAAVAEAEAALAAESRSQTVLGSTRSQSVAAAQQAQAAVEQAQLALDRTVIRAPVRGVVGARGVRVGQYVRPGSQILSLVPLGEAYVVANFKETQVSRLRLGQTVHLHADAFSDLDLTGHIDSFAPATGSEFALIPIENATGNFTKIAQRVPVRIRLDAEAAAALRPGLSVEARVDLKSPGRETFAQVAMANASGTVRPSPPASRPAG